MALTIKDAFDWFHGSFFKPTYDGMQIMQPITPAEPNYPWQGTTGDPYRFCPMPFNWNIDLATAGQEHTGLVHLAWNPVPDDVYNVLNQAGYFNEDNYHWELRVITKNQSRSSKKHNYSLLQSKDQNKYNFYHSRGDANGFAWKRLPGWQIYGSINYPSICAGMSPMFSPQNYTDVVSLIGGRANNQTDPSPESTTETSSAFYYITHRTGRPLDGIFDDANELYAWDRTARNLACSRAYRNSNLGAYVGWGYASIMNGGTRQSGQEYDMSYSRFYAGMNTVPPTAVASTNFDYLDAFWQKLSGGGLTWNPQLNISSILAKYRLTSVSGWQNGNNKYTLAAPIIEKAFHRLYTEQQDWHQRHQLIPGTRPRWEPTCYYYAVALVLYQKSHLKTGSTTKYTWKPIQIFWDRVRTLDWTALNTLQGDISSTGTPFNGLYYLGAYTLNIREATVQEDSFYRYAIFPIDSWGGSQGITGGWMRRFWWEDMQTFNELKIHNKTPEQHFITRNMRLVTWDPYGSRPSVYSFGAEDDANNLFDYSNITAYYQVSSVTGQYSSFVKIQQNKEYGAPPGFLTGTKVALTFFK